MTVKNLAIVFGPSLVDVGSENFQAIGDFRAQSTVVQTVLSNYLTIFD
jgi:hypothetical protein